MLSKKLKKFTLLLLFVCTAAYSDSKLRLEKTHLIFSVPSGLVAKKLKENDKSECFDISAKKGGRFVGQFCGYTDKESIRDQGIVPYSEIPVDDRRDDEEKSELVVTTGMSYYPMRKFNVKIGEGNAATVDCDVENGAVYRATSTCHVALVPLLRGQFLYGSLVVRNDVTKTELMSEKDVVDFWNRFEKY